MKQVNTWCSSGKVLLICLAVRVGFFLSSSLILIFSSLEMTLGRPEPSFLSAMGASEFFLAWSKILRRLLSGILSYALICFRGTEAFQSSTAALLTSLVGGIFKTGETRKIGLAYILRNGEFSCGRTVKFRPHLIRDHSSIPKKFGVPISKGLGAVHCQRPAKFFFRRLYNMPRLQRTQRSFRIPTTNFFHHNR